MTVVASNFDRIKNDLYQTEPWATRALLRHVSIGGKVWEPAAGNHMMADVLRERAEDVVTSDIFTYQRKHTEIFDFLNPVVGRWDLFDAIVTNPPYGKGNRDAAKFARLALQRCSGMVALLLTAKFDFGKTRADLFADNPRFHSKIALVDRIQWFPGDSSGTEDHAWYVWGPLGVNRSGPMLRYAGRAGNE